MGRHLRVDTPTISNHILDREEPHWGTLRSSFFSSVSVLEETLHFPTPNHNRIIYNIRL